MVDRTWNVFSFDFRKYVVSVPGFQHIFFEILQNYMDLFWKMALICFGTYFFHGQFKNKKLAQPEVLR